MIISNKARCLSCMEVIESKHRHDFVYCKCGKIAVDGGKDYLKRVGNLNDYEELSVACDSIPEEDEPIISSRDDIWLFLICTIRYSMGRRSYMPSVCYDLYHQYKKYLTSHQREQIAKEVDREIVMCEDRGLMLGDRCDNENWTKLVNDIRAEG